METQNGEDREIVDWALMVTNTKKHEKTPIGKLSGGQKQRVWIAMALAQKTEYLFLDEPTTFLDVRYQIQILDLLRRLNDEHKITVVMVLHDINQAVHYSDKIIGLKNGKTAIEGETDSTIHSCENHLVDTANIKILLFYLQNKDGGCRT